MEIKNKKKLAGIRMDPEVHKKLKYLSAYYNIPIGDVIKSLVEDYELMEKKNKK